MKKKLSLCIVLILMFTGCDSLIYDANPTREKEEAQFLKEHQVETVEDTLTVVRMTTTDMYALDSKGNVYETSSIGQTDVIEGTIIENCIITFENGEITDIELGFPRSVPAGAVIFDSDLNEVAMNSAADIVKRYVMNSQVNSTIKSYEITQASVTENIGDHIISIQTVFDVEPGDLSTFWGVSDEDGFVRGLNVSYTLYGVGNHWLLKDNYLADIKGISPVEGTTMYSPADNQKVLYETDTYSYYREFDYYENKEDEEIQEYKAPVRRVNRSSGAISRMYSGDENYDYYPVYQEGRYLYVETTSWEPYSEVTKGYFGILDVERKYMTEIIDGPASYGSRIGTDIYVFAENELYLLDTTSNEASIVAEFSIEPDYVNGGAWVEYVEENTMFIGIYKNEYVHHFKMDLETYDVSKYN